MKLIRCDRCRRELAIGNEPGATLETVTDYVPVTIGGTPYAIGSGKQYDLCKDCADAVTYFVTSFTTSELTGAAS